MNNMIVAKCSNCQNTMVASQLTLNQIHCHWCNKVLTTENKTEDPVGIPSLILPFKYTKEEVIKDFNTQMSKYNFFVNKAFAPMITEETLRKVYLPYLLVNVKAHSNFEASAESTANKNIVSAGEGRTTTKFDVDVCKIKREFDLVFDKLEVEKNLVKFPAKNLSKISNLIINIGDFNIEEAVPFTEECLKDATAERRTLNTQSLQELVEAQIKDINKRQILETIKQYDRGSIWHKRDLSITEQQIQVVYLPVYLYNYYQTNNPNSYNVVINGTTKEMIGYLPINNNKVIIIAGLIELMGFILMLIIGMPIGLFFLLPGLIFYFVTTKTYSTLNTVKPKEPKAVKVDMTNLVSTDTLVKKNYSVLTEKMYDANNKTNEEENLLKVKIIELNNKNEKF